MVIPRKKTPAPGSAARPPAQPTEPPGAEQRQLFGSPMQQQEVTPEVTRPADQSANANANEAESREDISNSEAGKAAQKALPARPLALARVPTTRSGDPRRDASEDVAFDPLLDIGSVARTLVREPESLTEMKPNELAAIIPSRPGVVLEYQEVKAYLLMHDYAIEQGLQDGTRLFRVNVVRMEREGGFGTKDRKALKQYIRNLIGATVEWNTPRLGKDGETTLWEASSMVAHARFLYDKNHMLVLEWQYSDPLLEKLKLVGHYFRMRLRSLRDTRTFGGQALYLYLSRYETFVGRRTDTKPWREWVPILTGKRLEDWDKQERENVGNSWRYFHRDVVRKAVAEVNSIQSEYRAEAKVRKVGVRVVDLWFELHAVPKPALEDAPNGAITEDALVKRLVALDYKQQDAYRILMLGTREDISNTLDYVENRLARPSGHQILNKRSYFRAMLAKFSAGEVKPEVERQAGDDVSQAGGETTLAAFYFELRKRLASWIDSDIRSTLAKGSKNEQAAALIRVFESEGLPTMHKQTQKAWAARGLSDETVRGDVVKWLGSHIHPIPDSDAGLHEMGVRIGLVKIG